MLNPALGPLTSPNAPNDGSGYSNLGPFRGGDMREEAGEQGIKMPDGYNRMNRVRAEN